MRIAAKHADMGCCPGANDTVLVVEDNAQAAKLLSLHLIQAGYRVLVAADGAEALRMAAQYRPMAITLDLLLPDLDGWQVLSELKTGEETRDIPVVIVSVLDRQALGFRLGAMDYLVKPVGRADLLRALRRCTPREAQSKLCRKVMVVDTDPDELKLLGVMLAQERYQVIEALGPAEAVSLARCTRPDLLVTNLLAGEMDLFAMLEALKTSPETAHIPVLALTAGAYGDDAAGDEGELEFVLIRDHELIEERLLDAITLLFRRSPLAAPD